MEETGIGISNPLFFIGVVENNVDERLEGRVQVRAFNVHGTVDEVPSDSLPWAIAISGSYDPNNPPPPLNAWVFGFFLDGRDAQQPMILGLIPTQMTEIIDPKITGWGRFPNSEPSNYDRLSFGSRARDFGQPMLSRLARGENIEETYVLGQEVGRVRDIPSVEGEGTWDEPSSAYNAQYPFNRVIETAGGHSIEIDDTPGAERIMINHTSGSYLQIDSRGTKVDKSVSDKYDITQNNSNIYIGGTSSVTIMGNSHVLVRGNKTEEITGDYTQIVRGNHMLSVAGQMNLNGSEEIQIRAASIRAESNVENINIKAAKFIKIQSGQSVHMKSGENIFQQAENSVNIKTGDDIFMQSTNFNIKSTDMFLEAEASGNFKTGSSVFIQSPLFNVKSNGMFLEATGNGNFKAAHAKIGGGTKVSLNAATVAADTIIKLASDESVAPTSASEATGAAEARGAFVAVAPEMPEPAGKGVATTSGSSTAASGSRGGSASGSGYNNQSSMGGVGYASQDDSDGAITSTGTSDTAPEALRPLLNVIAKAESESSGGYNAYNRGTSGGRVLGANQSIVFSSMLISDLIRRGALPITHPERIFAAGRYQIIPGTLLAQLTRTGISRSEYFSNENQDKLGISLLEVRGLSRFTSGAITKEQYGNNIAKEWAGLPVLTGPKAGQSYYGGDGYNESNVSASLVVDALQFILDYESTPATTPLATPTTGP